MSRLGNGKKYKRVFFVLLCVLFMILGFVGFESYVFYQSRIENDRLMVLKDDYLELCEEIEIYKGLKGQYEIILSESSEKITNKTTLEAKVSDLEKEIGEIEAKIRNVNKKIKSLS